MKRWLTEAKYGALMAGALLGLTVLAMGILVLYALDRFVGRYG